MSYWLELVTKEMGGVEEPASDVNAIAQAVIEYLQDDGDSCIVWRLSVAQKPQQIIKIRYSMGDFRISQLVKRLDQKWLQRLSEQFEEFGACVVLDEEDSE